MHFSFVVGKGAVALGVKQFHLQRVATAIGQAERLACWPGGLR